MTWIRVDKTAHTDKRVRAICYGCGSLAMKHTWSYLRVSDKFCKRVISEITEDGSAFYYASISKAHARLIGIAVMETKQRQGLGKKTLFRLLSQLKAIGVYKLTLRTSSHEEAQYFWLSVGGGVLSVTTPRARTMKWKSILTK